MLNSVSSVNFTGAKSAKNNKKRVAAGVTAGAVATAAVASAIGAYCLGKGKVDGSGIKAALPALKEGYKIMGDFISKYAQKGCDKTKELCGQAWDGAKKVTNKVCDAVKSLFTKSSEAPKA